ncbi:MAG: prepilin peptidase [Lachnospiraceae bacterium]|nr:prepilin peptidase [Lachnospiraceae bacterium]
MTMLPIILLYIFIFFFGSVVGSFLNVLIYRIPKHEDFVVVRSHCMNCGYQLGWTDLIPIFSWIALGGKCRKCKTRLSVQYPTIEALNGALYVLITVRYGLSIESLLYCFLFSALIALSVIDFRTYEIPIGFNIFILTLGLVRVATDYTDWLQYLIGFLVVSVPLLILYYATGGRGIGGGDVKLMAVCGLLIGWKLILLSLGLGCIIGSIIHVIRMKASKADRVLAMGPYLSVGIMIATLWGESMINWYLRLSGLG